jgi:hypothetical protein
MIKSDIKMPNMADLVRAAIAEVEKQIMRKPKGAAPRALVSPVA